MRITVHIPNKIEKDLKTNAMNENKSVSSLVAEAVVHYIGYKKRVELGNKMLNLAGKSKISPDVYKEIDSGRMDDRA